MKRLLVLAVPLTVAALSSGSPSAAARPNDSEVETLEAVTVEATRVFQEAPRLRSTSEQRDAVAITVYNQNFGLVREIRTLDLTRGLVSLAARGSNRVDRAQGSRETWVGTTTSRSRSYGEEDRRPPGPRPPCAHHHV